jgi:hypothetical protein
VLPGEAPLLIRRDQVAGKNLLNLQILPCLFYLGTSTIRKAQLLKDG